MRHVVCATRHSQFFCRSSPSCALRHTSFTCISSVPFCYLPRLPLINSLTSEQYISLQQHQFSQKHNFPEPTTWNHINMTTKSTQINSQQHIHRNLINFRNNQPQQIYTYNNDFTQPNSHILFIIIPIIESEPHPYLGLETSLFHRLNLASP